MSYLTYILIVASSCNLPLKKLGLLIHISTQINTQTFYIITQIL
jgi:hypothetical protein